MLAVVTCEATGEGGVRVGWGGGGPGDEAESEWRRAIDCVSREMGREEDGERARHRHVYSILVNAKTSKQDFGSTSPDTQTKTRGQTHLPRPLPTYMYTLLLLICVSH